ncbi:MAG: UDP-3-O-acyl-N-acetylglucosamine deacetylase [Alphaproteobacteria bacterium]|nr:UDP-3-O-acyl-N-acetylglucosamine deacetylase [Alphaproteobacteria bacterium]
MIARSGAARQKTLGRAVAVAGIGLHSGKPVTMTLAPAHDDSGIHFQRTDIPGPAGHLPARWDLVGDTQLCTALINDRGVRVGTIEHLMAAFAGCGIDNANVRLDGDEVPAMDGSAAPFVALIEAAGVVEQTTFRRAIMLLRAVTVGDSVQNATLEPGDGFTVDFEIEFDAEAVARQQRCLKLVNGTFKREIAGARTFGFAHEIDRLRSAGLARGGSLDNAVVVSGDRILNEEGLRYPDEFVRHKMLDALGDLYLAGAPIIGRFVGMRSGHRLNNAVLRALFADPTAWCHVRVPDEAAPSPVDRRAAALA